MSRATNIASLWVVGEGDESRKRLRREDERRQGDESEWGYDRLLSSPIALAMFGNPIILPGLPGHPIPDDSVDLLIHVDGTRCVAPPEIQAYHRSWQTFSLFEIVTRGRLHFTGSDFQVGLNETRDDAQQRQVWQELLNMSPTVQTHNGRRRLVMRAGTNLTVRRRVSQLIADALGVMVMERVLGRSYTAFSFVDERHDYEVLVGRRVLKLETRGRFNQSGRAGAIHQLDSKFGASRNYARAVGAIAYPSDRPARTFADVELLDPEGNAEPLKRPALLRSVLRHYVSLFESLKSPVVQELTSLVELPAGELRHVIDERDPRRWHWNRQIGDYSYFGEWEASIGNARIVGRLVREFPLPARLAQLLDVPKHHEGVGLWGVWKPVTRVLASRDTLRLLKATWDDPERSGARARLSAGVAAVSLSDGTYFAWAPRLGVLQDGIGLRRARGD